MCFSRLFVIERYYFYPQLFYYLNFQIGRLSTIYYAHLLGIIEPRLLFPELPPFFYQTVSHCNITFMFPQFPNFTTPFFLLFYSLWDR